MNLLFFDFTAKAPAILQVCKIKSLKNVNSGPLKISLPHRRLLQNAWGRVSKRTTWIGNTVKCDFEGFETLIVEPVVYKILSLIRIMGLEGDNDDIAEFIEEYS
ncbi:hypothetical protein TNCT_43551 [Trichonephila clavata]|uniref:Uncharacterized protein n=1 Tax=Trichonephila clavata TaxID=2740835 RepID=A0A8X6H3X4_TRICU|nr:hypothetical protein TNCT_43551 [Trichonephila clavata]